MALAISAVLFAIFAANIVLSSFGGNAFVGDIGEMLLLFGSAIAFVVAILKRERDAKKRRQE